MSFPVIWYMVERAPRSSRSALVSGRLASLSSGIATSNVGELLHLKQRSQYHKNRIKAMVGPAVTQWNQVWAELGSWHRLRGETQVKNTTDLVLNHSPLTTA